MLEKSKAEVLHEALTVRIAEMNPGERLMPVRRLMQEYSVSQLVVDQALAQLETDGRVIREPGRGIFVRDNSKTAAIRLGLVTPDWPSAPISELEEMLKIAGKSADCVVSRYNYPIGSPIYNNLPVREFDVMALLPDFNMLTPECVYKIGTSPVPVILCWTPVQEVRINSVSGDPFLTGTRAASYLIGKGHRKLAIMIASSLASSVIQARIEGFRAVAEAMHCELSILDAEIKSSDFAQEKTYRTMTRYLDTHALNFTAMYLLIDEAALAVTRALSERGITVPEQVSLIGSDASRHSAFYQPPLTTVGIKAESVAAGIIAAAKRLTAKPDELVHENLPPVLIERDSVRDLK